MSGSGAITGRLIMAMLLKVIRLGPAAVVTACIVAAAGTTTATSWRLAIGATTARLSGATILASAFAGQPIENRRKFLFFYLLTF